MNSRSLITTVGLLAAGAAALAVARRYAHSFGTTPSERAGALPGDGITEDASLVVTRAIGIGATAADVWPWLVQIGRERGGFYSYDGLENLLGLDIHSADEIVQEWQGLEVGDQVGVADGVGLQVVHIDTERAIVLEGSDRIFNIEGPNTAPFEMTWAFVLEPVSVDSCRLIVRERYVTRNAAGRAMVEATAVASAVMTHKMLRGIRDRAEEATSGYDHGGTLKAAAKVSA